MPKILLIALALGFSVHIPVARALDNGLALTPPLGWSSSLSACQSSEQLLRESTDALVSNGMRTAGYQYVILDDCWQGGRDAAGNLVADAGRFPSGIRAVAEYVHAHGLKFGLHTGLGESTCLKRPGSRGHEVQDARLFASWGVDFLQADDCFANAGGSDVRNAWHGLQEAVEKSGRPMVLSLQDRGLSRPWTWAHDVAHLWRTGADLRDCFDCEPSAAAPSPGLLQALDAQAGLGNAAGAGAWNDPGLLQVGRAGLSNEESRAQVALWAILAAPLIASNDVRNMDALTRALLVNRQVLAVDQDAGGRQGRRLRRDRDLDIWVRPLTDGDWAIVLLNRGGSEVPATLSWTELGLPPHGSLLLRDLWTGRNLGRQRGNFATTLAPHSVLLMRASP
jgi:alpha-galactosidase